MTVPLFGVTNQFVVAQHFKQGEDLPLYYDYRTGNVTIDTTNVHGGVLTGYGLQLPNGPFVPYEGFIAENHTPFMGTSFTTSTTRSVGESNFSGVEPGVYSLGNVMPENLSEDEMHTYFGEMLPFGRQPFEYAGFGVLGGQTFNPFSPQYRPSPFPPINDGTEGKPPIQWATEMSLSYDPGTGGLALNANGDFMSYSVVFFDAVAKPESFTPITDLAYASPYRLSEIAFERISAGNYSLGEVLSPGLDTQELTQLIEAAAFLGEPSHGSSPLDITAHGIAMSLAIVPEPSSTAFFLPILLGWLLLRRKME